MRNDFDTRHLWWIVWVLGTLLVAKVIWVAAEWLVPLPMTGTDRTQNNVKHSLHYRYRLASDARVKPPTHTATPTKTRPTPPRASLSAYRLVAIYSRTGYAVVTLTRGTKSFVLSSDPGGGKVEGFHLKDASVTEAHFQKGKETATLQLFDKKRSGGITASAVAEKKPGPRTLKKPEPDKAEGERRIVVEDGTRKIDRSLISEYSENPEKIWKNIGLYEVKSDGKLDGFKVRFVRRGSPFEKLGLKRGDIIKSINGEPIVDYATPMRMFKSADSIDDLSITIERNHEEQELKYEVK